MSDGVILGNWGGTKGHPNQDYERVYEKADRLLKIVARLKHKAGESEIFCVVSVSMYVFYHLGNAFIPFSPSHGLFCSSL